jgi:hypothetical protein
VYSIYKTCTPCQKRSWKVKIRLFPRQYKRFIGSSFIGSWLNGPGRNAKYLKRSQQVAVLRDPFQQERNYPRRSVYYIPDRGNSSAFSKLRINSSCPLVPHCGQLIMLSRISAGPLFLDRGFRVLNPSSHSAYPPIRPALYNIVLLCAFEREIVFKCFTNKGGCHHKQ